MNQLQMEIVQICISLLLVVITITSHLILKDENKKIKEHLPQIGYVGENILKAIKEAAKVDNTIFPNSLSGQALNEVSNVLSTSFSNIEKNIVDNKNSDEIALELAEEIKKLINKPSGPQNIEDKPVG